MKINFVGNYKSGYVGETADQIHITREIEDLGHTVVRIPQDEWREHILDGKPYPNVPTNLTADINIITKWHHFYDRQFIAELRKRSNAPVAYWVWDYMWDGGFPTWHKEMAGEADIYLTNEYGIRDWYKEHGIDTVYYFPFDVCDGSLDVFDSEKKLYDVVFFGSCIGQGDRIAYMTEIRKKYDVHVFSWNFDDWIKRGFTAFPAVYGTEFNRVVAESKVMLGFSVNPDCWGYWSNRVGKILRAGGCLLYQYAPGMELLVGDAMDYFSTPGEAIAKIDYYLTHENERKLMEHKAFLAGERFTSAYRVKQLMILLDRFIKTKGERWNY